MMPAPPHKQLKLGVSIVSYDIISRLIYDAHSRTQSAVTDLRVGGQKLNHLSLRNP
jgi:hypothetical protein